MYHMLEPGLSKQAQREAVVVYDAVSQIFVVPKNKDKIIERNFEHGLVEQQQSQ